MAAGLRGLIVVLWRVGLRICEALALAEADLDPRRGSLLVRRGKGGRRREVGVEDWAWEQLAPWLQARIQLPVGPLFCGVNGPTCGRPWSPAARTELRRTAREAGVRRRFAPRRPIGDDQHNAAVLAYVRVQTMVMTGFAHSRIPAVCLGNRSPSAIAGVPAIRAPHGRDGHG
jgi:integrase